MFSQRLWAVSCTLCALVAVPYGADRVAFGTRLTAGGTVTAGTSPTPISGVKGMTATLALKVDMTSSTDSLGSYTVTIGWDSTVVRLDSVHSQASDFAKPTVNYVNGGQVKLTAANANGVRGVTNLAQLFVHFNNDTVGKTTTIQPTFTELTAAKSFASLLPGLTTTATIANIQPPPVIVKFTPDSTGERVGFKPLINLTADLSQAVGVSLGSYAAKFIWDTTIMVLDSVGTGDYVAPTKNQPNGGELRLTAADANGRSGAPFSLAKLYFRFINTNFPTQTALTLSVSEMHAAGTFANLLPGVTAKNGKAVILGVLRGDINVDAAINALDSQLILQGVVGLSFPPQSPTGLPHGDADCNGVLQAKDAQIVLNYVVGNPVAGFCVGKIQ